MTYLLLIIFKFCYRNDKSDNDATSDNNVDETDNNIVAYGYRLFDHKAQATEFPQIMYNGYFPK